MEQVANKVIILILYQTKDPVWVLISPFKFTPRTAHSFLEAVASNYEATIQVTASSLQGKSLSPGTSPFPTDVSVCEEGLPVRFDTLFDPLGISKRLEPLKMDSDSLKEILLVTMLPRMSSIRYQTPHSILEKLGQFPFLDK